jgi:hypothetical protein
MTSGEAGHLTEEAVNDVLIGLSSPEADAHLAVCQSCCDRLEQFRSTMKMFNQTSLAWSESRPSTDLRAAVRPKARPAIFVRTGWALAAMALLAIGIPVWNHESRILHSHASASAPAPSDSETQIAEDNDLLRSVDAVLSENEASPLSDYQLQARPHPRHKARPELRNR